MLGKQSAVCCLELVNPAIHSLTSALINAQRAGTRNSSCHTSHSAPAHKASSKSRKTMNAGDQSTAPVMKPLCHKTSASQECCCDTCVVLTQGLNIYPLAHSLTHTHAHFDCQKRAGGLTAAPPVCIYLSPLAGCVLRHLPTDVKFIKILSAL